MRRPKMPIGIDDFEKLRTHNSYYVDKTEMIKELIENCGEVNLFTRPRRFGKSLTMSMLKNFFEIGTNPALFDGLAISKEKELCEEYMGQYPVISITLRATEAENYQASRDMIIMEMNREARRFSFLLGSDKLAQEEKNAFSKLLDDQMEERILNSSLSLLSELLHKHYGKKTIILIDEYDVPLAKANQRKYYKEMVLFIRRLFEKALKTNPHLEFAVLTGCLRVSKESIFTGLNNTKVYSLLNTECDEYFGFTDREVREMLNFYGLYEYYDLTKEWYDGYQVGHTHVYNPWDVINWCNQLLYDFDKVPKSYWVNSSGNEEVKQFIRRMGNGVTKAQVEQLLSGEPIQIKVEEQLTYDTIYSDINNMWSLLFATGYLTPCEAPMGNLVNLVIPNMEVRYIFRDSVLNLFAEGAAQKDDTITAICDALRNGDAAKAEEQLTEYLRKTISIRDTAIPKYFKESFYHGLLLGILSAPKGWSVTSNQESGQGYCDIAVEIEDEEFGFVIEVKYAEGRNLEQSCKAALEQMNNREYTAKLHRDGMQTVLKYGIAFYGKECTVVVE